jgi:hypothetical protein
VTSDEAGLRALAEISKTGPGCTTSLATPTMLIGTRVIKGGDMQAIRAAIKKQANWPER